MNGLNREFMWDTEAFLRRHPLEFVGVLDGAIRGTTREPRPSGLYDFDLQRTDNTGTIRAKLFPAFFGRQESRFTHRIRAFWLPWVHEGTASIQLDDRARYFFTSSLSGCRIQIVPGRNPLVLHIAGNQKHDQMHIRRDWREQHAFEGSTWRDSEAQQQLGSLYAQSRRFSSSLEYDRTGVACVVGFRSHRFHGWRFIAQGFQQNMMNGTMTISNLATTFIANTRRI